MDRRDAVEVVLRFADDLVDVTHVMRGTRWSLLDVSIDTIGADVVVRRGAGQPLNLEPGASVEHTIGHVTITIALVVLDAAPLPRRRVERRPYVYGTCSLVLHLSVWLIALVYGDQNDLPGTVTERRRPTRVARFATSAQTVKRQPKPPPDVLPITIDHTPAQTPVPDVPAPPTQSGATSAERTPAPTLASSVTPSSEARDSPSEPRRFDPSTSAEFDTVKTGAFSTTATGKTSGEQYDLAGANGQRKPLIVVSCDAAACLVIGGEDADHVRKQLQRRVPEIVTCYEKYPATAGRKVEMDFGIDDSGKVDNLAVGGVGDIDTCVTTIVSSIQFSMEK